jgi:hypothetical protein
VIGTRETPCFRIPNSSSSANDQRLCADDRDQPAAMHDVGAMRGVEKGEHAEAE